MPQPSYEDEPELPIDRPPTVEEQVAAQTWLLCRQHHELPPDRAAAVFRRIAANNWLTFDPFGGRDSFAIAVGILGAEAALKLFEESDLGALSERIRLYGGLNHWASAIYSLEELAARADRLIARLEANRMSLLATGYPSVAISPVHTPDRACARLLPVKHPLRVKRIPAREGPDGLEYLWPSLAPDTVPSADEGETILGARRGFWQMSNGTFKLDDDTPVEAVPYVRAALIGRLAAEDAARLEHLRPVVLEVRLAVLRELARAVRERDAAAPWTNSLILLAGALSDDDVHFLLRMDRFFLGHDMQGEASPPDAAALSLGGLSELVAVIGHFEEELTVGLLAAARGELEPLMGSEGPARLRHGHYFDAVASDDRDLVEGVLNRFLERQALARDFHGEFQRRLVNALASEFRVPIVMTVKRKHEPAFRSFAAAIQARLEGAEVIPLLPGGGLVMPPSTQPNTLARLGRGWRLRFNGRDRFEADPVGFRFLWELVSRRGERIRALDLDKCGDEAAARTRARDEEQARGRITKALDRVLTPFRDDPATIGIWRHFTHHIERGSEFVYTAPDDSAWTAVRE